jgi:ribulose-5-phosphate 4-epimerase/fuculose-1-phosphate aldolase
MAAPPPYTATATAITGSASEAEHCTVRDLIIASRILAHNGLLSAFGAVSARSATHPDKFYLLRRGEGVPKDGPLVFAVKTASIVPSAEPSPWSEHFIHSSLYGMYPEVEAVVHSHSTDVIPYAQPEGISRSRSRLVPVTHMAGFLDTAGVHVWDASHNADRVSSKNFLINSEKLGDSFAMQFSHKKEGRQLTRPIVLQTAHGFTAIGSGIPQVVYQAYYTQENAKILTQARIVNGPSADIRALSKEEAMACWEMNNASAVKAWRAWKSEVEDRHQVRGS